MSTEIMVRGTCSLAFYQNGTALRGCSDATEGWPGDVLGQRWAGRDFERGEMTMESTRADNVPIYRHVFDILHAYLDSVDRR
jgi:hypothetical protein